MSSISARVLIAISVGLMVTLFWGMGKVSALMIALLIGGGWLANTYVQWRVISSLAFVLAVGTAGYGVLLGSSSWPWLIAIIFLIAAWDLEQLARRVDRFDKIEGSLEAEHMKRLAFVSFLALVVGAAALSFKVSLSFGVAFLIAIVIVFGLIVALRLGVKTTE